MKVLRTKFILAMIFNTKLTYILTNKVLLNKKNNKNKKNMKNKKIKKNIKNQKNMNNKKLTKNQKKLSKTLVSSNINNKFSI